MGEEEIEISASRGCASITVVAFPVVHSRY